MIVLLCYAGALSHIHAWVFLPKQLRLTIRNCTHEESLNNLHIIMAEFDTLMKTHNTEKKKLHEHILVLRQECKKQAIQLEAQVRRSSL